MADHRARVLIISASIGAGHNQAANAIKAAWESKFPNDSIYIADFMADDNSRFNNIIKEIYLKTITISPDIYEVLYRWTWNSQSRSSTKVQDILFWSMRISMARLIRQYRPSLVICTHPFPCGALAYLKRNKRLDIPVIGVVTDFSIHPFWINAEVNQYIVAAPELQESLMRQGVSNSRVIASGIPIDPRFASPVRTGASPLNLGITKPVLLIMGGGLGLGPLQDLLLLMNQVALPLQLIVVAGNNTALYESLQILASQSRHKVYVLGYTQQIMELMQVADILITKPGALTISEALAMELPMLFYEPIPGQEMDNARFIINRKAASWLSGNNEYWEMNDGKIAGHLISLLSNPWKLTAMRNAAKQLGRPQAALTAVDAIDAHFANRLHAFEIGH